MLTCLLKVSFLQLYNLSQDPERKEFLDKLFNYMQNKGEHCLIVLVSAFDCCHSLSFHAHFVVTPIILITAAIRPDYNNRDMIPHQGVDRVVMV